MSLVTSRLNYKNALLYGISVSSVSRLQKIQNNTARLISRTKKSDHITPVLVTLRWLPIEQQIQYRLIFSVFKALQRTVPLYLQELGIWRVYTSHITTFWKLNVSRPATRKDQNACTCKRFDVSGAALWSTLPETMRSKTNVTRLKKCLKTFLLKCISGVYS